MLLPEEEEYNRRLEELNEIIDVLNAIREELDEWPATYYNEIEILDELLFKIEQNKPQRRTIVEAKSMQGVSIFGAERMDLDEDVKESRENAPVEVDNGSVWFKIVQFFNNSIVGRLFRTSAPAIDSQSTHTVDDTQNESAVEDTSESINDTPEDDFFGSINTNSNMSSTEEKIAEINTTIAKIDKVLGFKIDLESTSTQKFTTLVYNYRHELDDLLNINREQIESIVDEKLSRLIEASNALDEVYDKRMGEGPTGKVIRHEKVTTSVRDDYRQGSWKNVRRTCLDGFQNHLPQDALGTKCRVEFLVGDEWVDIETAKTHKEEIKEVRFVDNGVGYSVDCLYTLGSNKPNEKTSVGQFGEGLKLISVSSVNMGLGLEVQSRNWSAVATSTETTTINTREADKEEKVKYLAFDIKFYDGSPMLGSKTIFHNPTQELIDYALNLPEKIVALRDKEPEYIDKKRRIDIVDTDKGGIIFVKGIHLMDINTFFQYDFKQADVNPDRNSFNNYDYMAELKSFYSRLDDITIMKKLLKKIIEFQIKGNELEKNNPDKASSYWNSEPLEASVWGWNYVSHGDLWQQAFQEVCVEMDLIKEGQKAVILRNDVDKDRKISDEYGVVSSLPEGWKSFLIKAGVKDKRDVIPEYLQEEISTSFSKDVGKDVWNYLRTVIDLVQNHLPNDSNGIVLVRFQTIDGKWHDYTEFPNFKDHGIVAIKVCDTGVGYDYKNLGVIANVKDSNSAGRFGEGLKMVALAILRFQREEKNNQTIEYRSRDWVATPRLKEETLNEGQEREKQILKLVFDVKKDIHPDSKLLKDEYELIFDGRGHWVEPKNIKSKTIIHYPSKKMLQEFRTLGEKILYFSDKKPLHSPGGMYEILDYNSGRVYVKGLLIEKRKDLLFSYNLKDYDIKNRDRNSVDVDDLDRMIRYIYSNTQDKNLILQYLSEAKKCVDEGKSYEYREFNNKLFIQNKSSQASTWIAAFKELFGENAGIISSDNIDFSEIYRAKHLGVKLVPIPPALYKSLEKISGMFGEKIPTYTSLLNQAVEASIPVDEENLTATEKDVLDKLYQLNSVLHAVGEKPAKKIKVFDYPRDYEGKRVSGFCIEGEEDTIHISRSTIRFSLIRAADVFFHECAHMRTGADDPDAAFRDCLSKWLGKLALQACEVVKSFEDGGFYKTDITLSDISAAMKEIGELLKEHEDGKGEKAEKADEEKKDIINPDDEFFLEVTADGYLKGFEDGNDDSPESEESKNSEENSEIKPNPDETPSDNENPDGTPADNENPDENPTGSTLDEIE